MRASMWMAGLLAVACAGGAAGQGELLVAEGIDDRIVRYSYPGGEPLGDLVPAQSGGLNGPMYMTYGPDGNLYVSADTSSAVLRYDGATGAFIDYFVTPVSGSLARPAGLAFGPEGDLLVASRVNHRILKYDGETGDFLGVFALASTAHITDPFDILLDASGDLLVANHRGSSVTRLDGATGAFLGHMAPPTVLGHEFTGLALGGHRLYICGFVTDNILVVEPGGAPEVLVAPGAGGLDGPMDAVIAPDGTLLVSCDGGPGAVLRFDAQTGAFLEIVVERGAGDMFGARGLILRVDRCLPDCDQSGALDFFDFLCFQNRFATGAPEADCDGSGTLDFFDFLCFQNQFAAGCP